MKERDPEKKEILLQRKKEIYESLLELLPGKRLSNPDVLNNGTSRNH